MQQAGGEGGAACSPGEMGVEPVAVSRLEEEYVQPLRPRELCNQAQRLSHRLVGAAGAGAPAATLRRLPPRGAGAPAGLPAPVATASAAAAAETYSRNRLVGLSAGRAAPAARREEQQGRRRAGVGHSTQRAMAPGLLCSRIIAQSQLQLLAYPHRHLHLGMPRDAFVPTGAAASLASSAGSPVAGRLAVVTCWALLRPAPAGAG